MLRDLHIGRKRFPKPQPEPLGDPWERMQHKIYIRHANIVINLISQIKLINRYNS